MTYLFTKKNFETQKESLEDIFVSFFEILKQTDSKSFNDLKEQIRRQYQSKKVPASLQFQLDTFYKQLFAEEESDAIEEYLKNFYPHFFGGKKVSPMTKEDAKLAYLSDITGLYGDNFFERDPQLRGITRAKKIAILEAKMQEMPTRQLQQREEDRSLFNDLCKQLNINNNRFALTPDMPLEDKLIILKNDYFMLKNLCPDIIGECLF